MTAEQKAEFAASLSGRDKDFLVSLLISKDRQIAAVEKKIVDTDAPRVPKLAKKLQTRLNNLIEQRTVIAAAVKALDSVRPEKPKTSQERLVEAVDRAHALVHSENLDAFMEAADALRTVEAEVIRELGPYNYFPSFDVLRRAMDVRFRYYREKNRVRHAS